MSQFEARQPQPRSPYLWWGLAAIFVVGVLIALVLVLIFGRGAPQATPGPPSAGPTAVTAPTESTPSGGPDTCQLEAGNQQLPQEGPAAEWSLNEQGVVVPTSTAHGPALTSPTGVASCFSQDPQGALLAAAHMFAVLGQQQDKPLRLNTIEQRVLEGPAKDQLLNDERADDLDPTAPVAQVAGFRFVQYTETDAFVTLAATFQGRQGIAALTYHLVWQNGDWHFSGDDFGTAAGGQSTELSEFTPWGPR